MMNFNLFLAADSAINHIMLTFGGAMFFGVMFILLAHKLRVSAIVILLVGGITLGNIGTFIGIPELNVIRPNVLGDGLRTIIGLAVGIILFEGGMTLNVKGFKEASKEIRNILFRGVLVTWLLSALLIWLLMDYSFLFSLLAASLIIVTGPTVIGPLLKRIGVKKKIHHILHWEGVLIDAIGVFVALLCFKMIQVESDSGYAIALWELLKRIAIGIAMGGAAGGILLAVLHRKWVDEENLNIFMLSAAVAIFTISDLMIHESGLLSVTIAGFIVGLKDLPEVKKLKVYKAELIELLIGLLFVLLAARLDMASFHKIGFKGFILVLAVMFIVRPANIFISTVGSKLNIKEKLFLSWIGPRGIVAASMASLFALDLSGLGLPSSDNAWFLETFTYSVIMGTVIFQGFTAKWVGGLLGVLEPEPRGWMIVGANRFGRDVARYIRKQGFPVVLVDTNIHEIALAKRAGLVALEENAMNIDFEDHPELYGIGNVIALTENSNLNALLCNHFKQEDNEMRLFKWVDPSSEIAKDKDRPGKNIWSVVTGSQLRSYNSAETKDRLSTVALSEVDEREFEHILLNVQNNHIHPEFIPSNKQQDEAEVLLFSHEQVGFKLNCREHWVKATEQSELQGIYRKMLTLLKSDYPNLNIDEIQKRLMEQDRNYSSYVGYGVALPHLHIHGLDESVVMVTRVCGPLKDSHVGEDVDLMFMVLSPESSPKAHLKSISEISKFIMDEDNRNGLLKSKRSEDMLQVFFPHK
ncbi:MAG: cation:proton antiporter [Lentisphaeria bacterium]|nr:cation:proton antiporter [Lentisphaeria bacterium]